MAELSVFSPDGINSYNYKDAAARNMITPVFNDQTVYAVGDYCIYNNGLYKCTTAHTGAWSANDFTSVSVMDEIKNASGGGGGLSDIIHLQNNIISIDTLVEPVKVTDSEYDYYRYYVTYSSFDWDKHDIYYVYFYITRGVYNYPISSTSTLYFSIATLRIKKNYEITGSYNNIGVDSYSGKYIDNITIYNPNTSSAFALIEARATKNYLFLPRATKIVWV